MTAPLLTGAAARISAAPARAVPAAVGWKQYMGAHGKSFAFASAFMPPSARQGIAGIYAWCRYTDDLVDVPVAGVAEEALDTWLALSRQAYDGRVTGVELLDRVMPAARASGVSFHYPAELIEGMRMDLHHRPYEDLEALQLYLWRAAGTVGLWLAGMHGVRDPWALERAAMLGQAMQLTNIIRDVGEDLDRGRLYIPLTLLHAHGFTARDLFLARRTGRDLGPAWVTLVEHLMALAERDYSIAREALFTLPPGFRRAAAVASHVYEGIHDAVRRAQYRTLHVRAMTSATDKLLLACKAIGHA